MTPWAPPASGIRAARAASASVVVTTAAAGAHLTSGGRADETVVLVLAAVLAPLCWVLTARRLSAGQLTGLLVVAQAVLHAACSGSEPVPGVAMAGGHAVATLLSLVVLLRGERALLALADRVMARSSVPRVEIPVARTVVAILQSVDRVVRGLVLVMGERAPPVAA